MAGPPAMNEKGAVAAYTFLIVGLLSLVAFHFELLGPVENYWLLFLGAANIAAVTFAILHYHPRPWWQWWVILAALILFLVGSIFSVEYNTLGNLSRTRSLIPDLITMPGYVLLAAGLLGIARSRGKGSIDIFDTVLDGLMVSFSMFALTWVYLIQPVATAHGSPYVVRLTLAAYPSLSLFLVIVTIRLAFTSTEHRSPSYWLLLSTLFLVFVGDASYMLADADIVKIAYSTLALPYAAGYVLSGASLLHPSMRGLTKREQTHEVAYQRIQVTLVALALATPAFLIFGDHDASLVNRSVIFSVDLGLVLSATTRIFRSFWSAKKSERDLAHIAAHDVLTGLPNRRLVVESLSRSLETAEGTDEHVALIFMDLDQFKQVNDSFGHSYGDRLLIDVAERLRKNVRRGDLVARLGGDEFLVVLQALSSVEAAHRIALGIRDCLRTPFVIDEIELFITGSLGLAFAESVNKGGAEHLLRDADTAMYQAKAAGRDTVITFNDAMQTDVAKRLELKFDLRSAIEKDQLHLAYQPIVRARDRRIEGAEALLRWKHPTLGLVPPSVFIPLAEESNLILSIGTWVLETAIAERASLQRDRIVSSDFYIAINLSAAQLVDERLVEHVEDILKRHGVSGDKICIELTESMVMENPEKSISILSTLKRTKVTLAIDDFGSGYSSLAYLTKFPVDKLKIDKSFVDSLTQSDTADETLIAAIVAMSKSLGISTIAEGVETRGQEMRIRALGCDAIQGYLISRPIEIDQLKVVIGELRGGHHGLAGVAI